MDDSSIYSADMNAYGIYLLKEEYDDDEESILVELTKYDLKGKEEYTKDLTDQFNDNSDKDDLYALKISDIDVVNNGFIVSIRDYCRIPGNVPPVEEETTNSYFHTSHNPCKIIGADDNHDQEAVAQHDQFAFTVLNTSGTQPGQESASVSIEPGGIVDFRTMPVALIKFSIDYEITTKTEGNGTVKVLSKSEAGTGVTFQVEPKKGYVLSVVKVTDANGNVIEFTDYTFTMPSSDVLIEAVFVPENPYTADIAIVAVLLLAIAGGVLLIKGRKNLKWLK